MTTRGWRTSWPLTPRGWVVLVVVSVLLGLALPAVLPWTGVRLP